MIRWLVVEESNRQTLEHEMLRVWYVNVMCALRVYYVYVIYMYSGCEVCFESP